MRMLRPVPVMLLTLVPVTVLIWMLGEVLLPMLTFDYLGGKFPRPDGGSYGGPFILGYIVFTPVTVVMFALAATLRRVSDRTTPSGYWVFVISALALCSVPLIFLTASVESVVDYIIDMGVTPRRIWGLLLALGVLALAVGFVWWVLRPPKIQQGEGQAVGSSPP